MRKTLLALLACGTIGCASLRPALDGNLDLSYVPYRDNVIHRTDEMKAGINMELRSDSSKNHFYINGNGEAFAGINNLYYGFQPHRLNSTLSLGYRTGIFDFYVRHSSDHAIDDQGVLVMLNENKFITDSLGNRFYNENGFFRSETATITEIGVKIKIRVGK